MKRASFGFTLVELLVVITIISILMGLLIPAVNAARETARRNQCSVNVKNLALAAVQHENSKGELPGFIQKYGFFPGGVDRTDEKGTGGNYGGSVPAHVKVGGFGIAILPWLDAQPTYEHWTQDSYPILADGNATLGQTGGAGAGGKGNGFHTLAAPNLAIFQCPSNPNTDAQHGRNSYIMNNGMSWYRTAAAQGGSGSSAVFTASHKAAQDRSNGVGMNKYLGDPKSVPTGSPFWTVGPNVTLDDMKDGQGYTAIYAENVQAIPWYLPGFVDGVDMTKIYTGSGATGKDLDFSTVNVTAPGEMICAQFGNGWVWHYEDPNASSLPSGTTSPAGEPPIRPYKKHLINGGGNNVSEDIFVETMTIAKSPDLARPSSAHVDGVNVAFADGATRFVTQDVDYRVYQAIMTPRGKSANVPWPEFILTDELGE